MVYFSWYSDISILISASSAPKISLASCLAKWVLPTPVEPKKIKEPIGRLGSLIPTRFLRIAFAIFSTANSWPMTEVFRLSSRFNNDSLSSLFSLLTGILVIVATTLYTISSVIGLRVISFCFSNFSFSSSNFFKIFFSLSLSSAAFSYCWDLTTWIFSSLIEDACSLSFSITSGNLTLIWALAPTSSIMSIALSGNSRSVIYRSASVTHAFNDSSL